jgi:hypothetical protein
MKIELRKLIGHQVIVMGPAYLDKDKRRSVQLLAVEEQGIWIESQEAADNLVGSQKRPSSAGLAFFIPFQQIVTIIAGFEPSGAE